MHEITMTSMSFLETAFVNSWFFGLWRKKTCCALIKAIPCSRKKVLEIGCGNGTTTNCLAEHCSLWNITATEYDTKQLAIAIKTALRESTKNAIFQNVTFERADAESLKYKNNAFDTAFAFLTLHHVKNWKTALTELHRVLKPKGQLYVEDLCLKPFPRLRHLLVSPPVAFSKEEFCNVVRETGFEIKTISGTWRFWVVCEKNEKK